MPFKLRRGGISILATLAILVTAGCGGAGDDPGAEPAKPVLTADTLGDQRVLTPAEWLESKPYAAADPEAGQKQARACLACHSLADGGANMIGPNLYGFFGRSVGAANGFAYSRAIEEADFVWTPRALDAWLAEPANFLPGNRMTYPGVRNEGDRNNLIAYLLLATSDVGGASE